MNPLHTSRIAIVGAGLAGLYAAYLLEQRGINDYVLLEARDVLGGRIASVSPDSNATLSGASGAFDLGPSWFWPGFQHALGALVESLGLTSFAQFETGDMIVERSVSAPPVRMQGFVNAPPSMRLNGGMKALIEALRQHVNPERIITGQTVRRLAISDKTVELNCEAEDGRMNKWRAEHLLLAVPPRLAEQSIAFSPSLPVDLARQWHETATWMAPHAKYIALYSTPFWRQQNLSGEARSLLGPLGEIHDASHPDGHAALFGFFSLPAQVRESVGQDVLRQHCRTQLARLFGPQAASPVADFIKDWASEPLTTTPADHQPSEHHSMPPPVTTGEGPWRYRLTGIASEWGPQFSGYLAGAVEAAANGIAGLPDAVIKH
jgi:monoamine oxidase